MLDLLSTKPAPTPAMKPRASAIQRHSLPEAYEPPSLERMFLLAIALFALALPMVGPLDDHHFAERSHTHGHIYLDGRPATHRHQIETRAAHWHATAPTARNTSSLWNGVQSTVYLTDPAVGLLLSVLTAPSHNAPEALRPAPPHGKESNPLTPFAAAKRQPEEQSVAPPLPPPIA